MKRKVSIVILTTLLTLTLPFSKVFAISSNGGTVNTQMNNKMGNIIDSTTVDGWHSSGGYWTFNYNDWNSSFRVNDNDVANYFSGTSKTFNENLVISRDLPQAVKDFIRIYGKDKVGIKITVGKDGSILNNAVSYTLTDTTIKLNFRPILRYNRYNMWEYHNPTIWGQMTKKVHTPEVTDGYGENYVSIDDGAVGMKLNPSIMRSAYKASDGKLRFTSTEYTVDGSGNQVRPVDKYALNNFFSGGSSGVYFRYPINIEFYDLSVGVNPLTINSYEYYNNGVYWVKSNDSFNLTASATASGSDSLVKVNANYFAINENGTMGYINARMKESQTSNNSILGTNMVNILGGANSRSGNTLTSNMVTSLSGDKDITVFSFGRLIRFPNSGIEDFGNEQIYKQSANSNTITIKSDSKAPTVSGYPDSSKWNNSNVSFTLSAADERSGMKSMVLYESGKQVATGKTSINYTASKEGEVTYKIVATDNVGNTFNKEFVIKIDKTKPTVTYNPNNKTWINKDIGVNISVADSLSGVKSWKYAISTDNGATWGNWINGTGTSANVTISKEGTTKIKTEVIDKAGNTVTVTSGSYQLDKTNPTVIYNPNDKTWTNKDISVNISVADSLSGVKSWKYAISTDNGATWGNWINGTGTSANVTISKEGTTKIKTEVIDKAGNTVTVTSGSYQLDKTNPTVIYNPNDKTWTNKDISVNISVADSLSGVKSWKYAISTDNGATWGNWINGTGTNANMTISKEGISKIKTEVIDNSGNVNIVISDPYYIDKTAPTGDVEYDFNDETLDMNITVDKIVETGSGLDRVWVEYYPKDDPSKIVIQDLIINGNKATGSKNIYDELGNVDMVGLVVKATDKVGNEGILGEHEVDMFNLSATIERVLEPHDPIFKSGEKGILKIKLYGGVDKVKVTFPTELSSLDDSLDTEFNLEPKKTDNIDYEFYVPIDTPNKGYMVQVKGYKNGREKVVYPTFTVTGNMLDDLRTKILFDRK